MTIAAFLLGIITGVCLIPILLYLGRYKLIDEDLANEIEEILRK